MRTHTRLTLLALATFLAFAQSGCATVLGALAGAALCGDSSECESDMIRAGAAVDVAVAGSVVDAALNSESNRDDDGNLRPRELSTDSAGGEEPPLRAGAYYHCVDAEGRHVIEVVAPSELDARFACAVELGYEWSDERGHALCSCHSRG